MWLPTLAKSARVGHPSIQYGNRGNNSERVGHPPKHPAIAWPVITAPVTIAAPIPTFGCCPRLSIGACVWSAEAFVVDELEFEGFNAGSVRVPAGSGGGGGGGVVGSAVFCADSRERPS